MGSPTLRLPGVVAHIRALMFFAMLCVVPAAYATSSCWQWEATDGVAPYFGPWENSVTVAAVDVFNFCEADPNACGSGANCPPGGPDTTCDSWSYTLFPEGFPYYGMQINYVSHYSDGSSHPLSFATGFFVRHNPVGSCQVYASASAPPAAQPLACPNAPLGDPINPASACVFKNEKDLGSPAGVLHFQRFYTSTDSNNAGNLSPGWRHSYQRNVSPRYGGTGYAGGYVTSPTNSSLYNDEATACTSGFSEVKSQVSAWANATASYSNGVCLLTVGTTVVGVLPLLYSSYPTPDPASEVLVGYDATRDNGQLVSFLLNGATITPPPGISLRLQQSGGNFALTDEQDNVEVYDSSGRLLSVTTRTGIVQTVNYDGSGRLSTVTDSFGHSLSMGYDTQGRLSSVTAQ
jgi:YD repeat-containing protein